MHACRDDVVILFVLPPNERDDDVATAFLQAKMAKDRRLKRDTLEACSAAVSREDQYSIRPINSSVSGEV